MVKFHSRHETRRVVAGTTCQTGWNMDWRLAFDVIAVVATLAGGRLNRHVTENNTRKTGRRRRMATVASRTKRYVFDWLSHSTPGVILDMTGRTFFRGPLEDTIQMACFAPHRIVRPAQRKSCTHVIEGCARRLGLRQTHRKNLQQGKCKEYAMASKVCRETRTP